ncbi:MAG: hypothetical protein KJ826_01765 [Proteobacteria bacterium]|nr:hypothetical protein [Pseudomonadota bacterium]
MRLPGCAITGWIFHKSLLGLSPFKIPKKAELDWLTIATVFPAAPGINLEIIEPVITSSVFISGSKAAKHAYFVALLSQREQYQDIHVSVSGGIQSRNI